MDTIKIKAIVISAIDYKEKDKLVTLFSLENGIISAKLKSVKVSSAKLKFAKEPFCFGEFIIQKPTNIITSVEVIDTFYDVTKSIDKYYCACAILEIIKQTMQLGETNQQFFIETLKALSVICYEEGIEKYALSKFLLSVFYAMGYQFTLDKCAECGQPFRHNKWLNLEYGEIVCSSCRNAGSVELSPKCHAAFKLLANTDYENLKTLHLAKGSEGECLDILNQNFQKRFNKQLTIL